MSSLNITKDLLQHPSLVNLALEFAGSRNQLRDLKLRKKKSLIGVVMPNIEIVCATGGYPTYGIRMLPFAQDTILNVIDMGRSLFGPTNLTKIVNFLGKFKLTNNLIEGLINEVVDGVFNQYNRMFENGVEKGTPNDECYGIKVIEGFYHAKGKNFDGNFFQSIRCSAFQKLYESCAFNVPSVFIDVPPYKTKASKDLAVAEVNRAITQLEKITGETFTNNRLREVCEITNKCKDYSERLIKIALGDYYTIHPISFAKILGLIEILFQDYLSNPGKLLKILKSLTLEMESQIKKGDNLIDVSNYPKILFTSRFGGWDYIVGDYVYNSGGRVIYADWHIYGFMDRIKTTGDMVDNYAEYLLSISNGFGPDNEGFVNRIINFTLENDFQGLIYNQLFGCHSLSTSYARLRKKLIREEIPSTLVSFNNIGENREQLKTRVVALLELINQ